MVVSAAPPSAWNPDDRKASQTAGILLLEWGPLMRKAILVLSMTATAFIATTLPIIPAVAAGPALVCNVSPGNGRFAAFCENGTPAFTYTITYQVQGVTGSASYSWTPPSSAIVFGCTSTSTECAVTVPGRGKTSRTATVVITQGSAHTTLSDTADIEPVCASPSGPVFC